jgi:hypothetical protein
MIDSSGLRGAAPIWNGIMQGIYADPTMVQSLMVNGAFPANDFVQPQGIELRTVCLPGGTGGSNCSATRQDWFLANAGTHAVPRISYSTSFQENWGAWTLTTMPIAAEDAQRYVDSKPALIDVTTAPRPSLCVVNSNNPPDNAQRRLYLSVPPHYPDEVRARQWAAGTGYQMAPPTVCSRASLQP